VENHVRLLENPVWSAWVSYNELWDRIDAHDNTETFVDRLCTFINPEGMKSLMEKRSMDEVVEERSMGKPKDQVKLPYSVLNQLSQPEIAGKLASLEKETLDDIEVG